jgi:hypothetical protein
MHLPAHDPQAADLVTAIHNGDVERLKALLRENSNLATARIVDAQGAARTLLHIATDWPGHFPSGPETVAALIAAGADVDAPMIGPHAETPLRWAASSDDVAALDALLDGGANIEAPGAVFKKSKPNGVDWHTVPVARPCRMPWSSRSGMPHGGCSSVERRRRSGRLPRSVRWTT